MKKSTPTFATLLQGFFTERLMKQRQASPHTIKSYRDTFRLLLHFTQEQVHKPPSKVDFSEIDAPLIATFLETLEKDRSICARSRNLRLTAIKSFFRYAALEMPAHSAQIQRVLAIPGKRHERPLIGRDDGDKRGEFCPILIDTRKFAVSNSGTFWLSDTPEQCHNSWDFPYKRICTWAQVQSLGSGCSFFVFNSHFPLNPGAHERSAKLIAGKKLELCGSLPCFIAADFNCDSHLHPERAIQSVGMRNCATPFGKGEDQTIKLFGKPFACVDAVFASTDISVDSYEIVGNQSGPDASDHYGIFVRGNLPGA